MARKKLPARRRVAPSEQLRRLVPQAMPVAVTLVTAVIALYVSLLQPVASTSGQVHKQIDRLEQQAAALEAELVKLLSASPPRQQTGSEGVSSELLTLQQEVHSNAEAIRSFHELMLSEPESLVTLPLLQRDFQALRDELSSTKESVRALQGLVTEINGQNRWVIGTLALGMLALVIPALRSLFPSTNQEAAANQAPKSRDVENDDTQ